MLNNGHFKVILAASAFVVLASCIQIQDSAGPEVAAAITLVSGNSQSGMVGQPLAQPLVVKVTMTRWKRATCDNSLPSEWSGAAARAAVLATVAAPPARMVARARLLEMSDFMVVPSVGLRGHASGRR